MRLRTGVLSSLFAAALALGSVSGCALEGVEDPGGPGPSDGDNPDPLDDGENEDPKEVVCRAQLAVTGTIELSQAEPADRQGCWPVGTWTIDVTVADPGECDDVPIAEQYVYEIVLSDPNNTDAGWEYVFPADPDNEYIFLKVTEGGGRCQGSFEHYSDDRKQFTILRPFEESDNVLAGVGEYEFYVEPQL